MTPVFNGYGVYPRTTNNTTYTRTNTKITIRLTISYYTNVAFIYQSFCYLRAQWIVYTHREVDPFQLRRSQRPMRNTQDVKVK